MSDYMTPDEASKIIGEIIEEDDFVGDVYLKPKMTEALNFAKRYLMGDIMRCNGCKHQEENTGFGVCFSCKWDNSLVDNFEPKAGIKASEESGGAAK